MSVSSHCVAIKPATTEYLAKAAAWRACRAAGVAIPDELLKFFDYHEPDDSGMLTDLGTSHGAKHPCCKPWGNDMCDGFQVDLGLVPEGTRFIRFYTSY
jgi:hypothetical protein